MAKTSLVMLGAIGAATLAAHKLWPKGVTYGEKEAWESEKDRAKDKLKDAKAAVTGEPRRDGRRGRGDDDDRRRRRHRDGGGERDRSRERRRRYLEDRGLRDRDARARDGGDGRRLVPPTAAAAAAAAAGGVAASYHHDGRRRGDDHRGAARDRPRDGYDDDDGRDYDRARGRRDRYPEAAPPAPPPPPAAPSAPSVFAAGGIPPRRAEQLFLPPAAPTPPPVPNPPSVYREAATVVATGARDSERGGRRYYVDSDTVVIPSRAEMEFVVRRDAPPANRLTVERDGRYYR